MDIEGHGGGIPMPISSAYIGGRNNSSLDDHDHDNQPPPIHIHHHHSTNCPPPLSALAAEDHYHHQNITSYATKKGGPVVKYEECLKNHAASIGGTATDGCGEFMPSGEEGTLEALKCSACGCHRNFHRKEIEGGPSSCGCFHYPLRTRNVMTQRGFLVSSGSDAFGYNVNSLIPRVIMPLGGMQASESDEMEGMVGGMTARPPMAMRKRFRTKFTQEQKERMLDFAEKVGWRLQRQEESLVQQFCQEIGVKRRVFKVWMHNNKHNLAKKSSSLQLEPAHS